jgi:hypothetical protein
MCACVCVRVPCHPPPRPAPRARQTKTTKTQLIAHDKEVYDIAFAKGKDVFATVGADGSVRMFDLRSLEHSTIMYESDGLKPLLRLSWNKQDANYLATVGLDSSTTTILDIRCVGPRRAPARTSAQCAGRRPLWRPPTYLARWESRDAHCADLTPLPLSPRPRVPILPPPPPPPQNAVGTRDGAGRPCRQRERRAVGAALVVPHLHGRGR